MSGPARTSAAVVALASLLGGLVALSVSAPTGVSPDRTALAAVGYGGLADAVFVAGLLLIGVAMAMGYLFGPTGEADGEGA